jgi:hypothetical protein
MAERVNVVSFRDWVDPADKNEDWILRAVRNNYEFGGAKSLLDGKNVNEIKKYAAGDHDMAEFMAMFPDPPKKRTEATATIIDKRIAKRMGIDFKPLGILQQPLSAAIAVLQKQLTYVNFEAIDATANANRQMDLDRVRNRPLFERAISPAKNVLGMPLNPVGTEFNSPTVDIASVDLDPQKEDELNLWADLFYKLRPETAFEVAIDALMYWNNFKMKSDLCKRDDVYYGVRSSRNFISDITGLPQFDYVFPGHVFVPNSELPDFSDVPFKYIEKSYDVEGLLNIIGKESIDASLIHGLHEDYWRAAGYSKAKWANATETQKRAGVPVVYMEFKSFDVMRVERKRTRSGRLHVEVVPFDYKQNGKKNDPNDEVVNKWPQQTYYAYWIPGTDHILKSGKVLGSFRAKGKESVSRFTIQVFKSKEKSDVELCIPLVKDAQRAYIKLQQAIIMSKPRGQYVDMKFIRNAAESLAESMNLSVETLYTLFAQHNILIGDSEGMDGANEGNFKPFQDIPGGLTADVNSYWTVIAQARGQIDSITGFNNALTGQTPNPDQLVGLQKLLLQSAMNSLHYSQKAHRHQTEQMLQGWTPMIQFICRKENRGSEARKALENIIGARKIDVLNDMDSLPAHLFGLRVEDAPNEEAQAELKDIMMQLLRTGGLEFSDYFAIRRILNFKDAQQLLVIKEKKRKAEMRAAQQENNAAMLQAEQMRSNTRLQEKTISAQGEIQEEQVKAESNHALFDKKAALELQLKQIDAQIEVNKKAMQGDQQRDKLFTKHNLDLQKP